AASASSPAPSTPAHSSAPLTAAPTSPLSPALSSASSPEAATDDPLQSRLPTDIAAGPHANLTWMQCSQENKVTMRCRDGCGLDFLSFWLISTSFIIAVWLVVRFCFSLRSVLVPALLPLCLSHLSYVSGPISYSAAIASAVGGRGSAEPRPSRSARAPALCF